MRKLTLLGLSITVAAILACGDDLGLDGNGGSGGGVPAAVLLKDIVLASVPAPYYHFEYDDAGRINRVSFADSYFVYVVRYQDGRISEMQNDIPVNHDRLQYVYDATGRVEMVNYRHPTDSVFARVRLTYDGDKLRTLERERSVEGGFTVEKTMSLSYYADGNLQEIVDHRPALNGSQEYTTVYRFEQYDDHVNVDGFDLLHNDFFDHVVLLPNVQLQKGNPALETVTGGGTDYRFDYTYTYDEHNRPLAKGGTTTILTGPDAGRTFPVSAVFSYY